MKSNLQHGPINLTDAVVRLPWSDVDEILQERAEADRFALEIKGLAHAEREDPNPGDADTVYVVVSGYGVLHCPETAMECTKDDVLYIPKGQPHYFERLDGDIRVWRISLPKAHTGES